jgi:hypothetical protein
MKKWTVLIMVLAAVALAAEVFAAGTVTVTKYYESRDKTQVVFKLACVGDGANGSVPATAIPADSTTLPYYNAGYYLYEVWTVTPGASNPDAADVAITDALGATLFSQANVISAVVSTKTEGTVTKYRQVNSALTVTVSNQATASATWDIYVKLSK